MNLYFIIFSTLLCTLLGFLRYKYSYWNLKGVKQLKTHFLFGNLSLLRSIHFAELLQSAYDTFKGKANLVGAYIFFKPVAIILDLDLVKFILVKDFNKFVNRFEYHNEIKDPLSGNLFMVSGEKWRTLRSKLSPTFSSGRMKSMLPLIIKIAEEFQMAMEKSMELSKSGEVEMYDIMGRYTTDVIGSCAFGIECNSLKDPNVEFRQMGKRIFKPKFVSTRARLFSRFYENVFKLFGVSRFDRTVEKFVIGVVTETVIMREKNNIKRNDFINLLMELKNSKDENGVSMLTISQMAAQVFIFFAAGFETSSSNLTFGLYELAKHPDIQEKVRNEIIQVLEKHDDLLTYEAMMEMKYLDQIISETLRMYPALAGLTRIADEDYKVPGTDIILEKGVRVYIPVKAIHYDPDIYDSPEEFRPERFSPEEVRKRHTHSFLGFGEGPRNCIGSRFGRMQVHIGFIKLLQSFRFSVCEKTPKVMEISSLASVMIPGNEVWLKVEKL